MDNNDAFLMAKAKLKGPVDLISGTIGGFTYVPLHGQQIIRRAITEPVKRSAGQKRQQDQIKLAAEFWRKLLEDPAKKAFYFGLPHVPGMGAYQLAVRDFCHPPVVEEIDASGCLGGVGDPIWVRATDDTAVVEVLVQVHDMTGVILEEGLALLERPQGRWGYRLKNRLTAGQTVSISVAAKDQPGHSASKSTLAYGR
jgi:hypothetical protein